MTTTPDTTTTAAEQVDHHLRWRMSSVGEPIAGRLETGFRAHRIVATERGNQILVTVNGTHVYTYQDMDAREATARAMAVISTVEHVKTPDSHADHWYPRGRDEYAERYYRWFPKYRRVTPPIPPLPLPDIGDLVEYSDDGESPEAEGPAVVLTVAKHGYGWAWDLHTRGGVLRAVKNADCMRLIRTARMDKDAAWWIREHVWTKRMRKEFQNAPGDDQVCACQYGKTGHCSAGRHGSCNHTATSAPMPSPETYIVSRAGYVMSFNEEYENGRGSSAKVWLADRVCAWKCSCKCHKAMAEPIAAPKPIRAPAKAVKGDQLDLFAFA